MRESDSSKPAIFAMSNPTMNGLFLQLSSGFRIFFMATEFHLYVLFAYSMTAECTAADAFRHAGENIVFASGSPFENVDLGISHFYFSLSCFEVFWHHIGEALASSY
jgi:malate dehydrogenase (decarboxylating)